MIERYIKVKCDNCTMVMTLNNLRFGDIYTSIRAQNWAVSKDRVFVFCPECKPKVSNVGRNGVKSMLPFSDISHTKKECKRLIRKIKGN